MTRAWQERGLAVLSGCRQAGGRAPVGEAPARSALRDWTGAHGQEHSRAS